MNGPAFSVLISVYAKEKPEHLAAALDSVFAQTLLPDEIILVKDGPLPAPLDLVIAEKSACHTRIHVIALEKNVGLGAALNIGLVHCRNELVARMDSDDLCVPDRFESQIPLLWQDDRTAVIGGWITEFEHDTNLAQSVRRVPEMHKDICRLAKTRCPVNHPTVAFRKSAILAVGGYSAKHLQEDYYLWVRLILAGYRFHNVQQPIVHMRTGDGLYQRRGGFRYAKAEVKLLLDLYNLGFLNILQLIIGVMSRSLVRLVPTMIRKLIYARFVRTQTHVSAIPKT